MQFLGGTAKIIVNDPPASLHNSCKVAILASNRRAYSAWDCHLWNLKCWELARGADNYWEMQKDT